MRIRTAFSRQCSAIADGEATESAPRGRHRRSGRRLSVTPPILRAEFPLTTCVWHDEGTGVAGPLPGRARA
jgi:hypothetical protein